MPLRNVVPVRTEELERRSVTPIRPVGRIAPEPRHGLEYKFATTDPSGYKTWRFITDMIPFASLVVWPTAREEFEVSTIPKQLGLAAFETVTLFPGATVGRGIRVLSKGAKSGFKAGAKRLPFYLPKPVKTGKPFASRHLKGVRYTHKTTEERLLEKFPGIDEGEAAALAQGSVVAWSDPIGRSGLKVPLPRSKAFKRLFSKKTGELTKEVKGKLKEWAVPEAQQMRKYYERLAEAKSKELLEGTKYSWKELFTSQAVRIYGEKGLKMTVGNTADKELGNIIKDMVEHGTKVRRAMDITGWSQIRPIRKVLGPFEPLYQTMSRVYKPIKEMFDNAHSEAMNYAVRWQTAVASRSTIAGEALATIKKGRFKEHYTRAELDEAGRLATYVDQARMKGIPDVEVEMFINAEFGEKALLLWDAHREWFDYMYLDFVKKKLPLLFGRAGVTEKGRVALDAQLGRSGGIFEKLEELFVDPGLYSYKEKLKAVEASLGELRASAKNPDNLFWFTGLRPSQIGKGAAKDIAKRRAGLVKDLTMRKKGEARGFINYLEDYAPRIQESEGPLRLLKRGQMGVPARMEAFWTKSRLQVEAENVSTDIHKMVSVRSRGQARDLYVYSELPKIREVAETLPENLKWYVGHYVDRMLGFASPVDFKVANWLSRGAMVGWDPQRVQQLAFTVNDLIYMGGIGFKPFSAMRNFFQPLLNVPADMGGIKDMYWLGKGTRRAMTDAGTREYIRSIGAIREYSPDIMLGLRVSKYESRLQNVRDMAMWMFKNSDRWNRYVTGASALEKWEHLVTKFAGKRGHITTANHTKFSKALKLSGREAWVKADIDRALRLRNKVGMDEAKKIWVNDVISDTQYLYGVGDSPIITQTWGAPGRVALVFQSWWMNYADLLHKWMYRAPIKDNKAQRMFTFLFAGAIAHEVMSQMWGRPTAARTALLGPLPAQLDIPPTFKPFFEGAQAAVSAVGMIGTRDPTVFKRKLNAAFRSSMIYVPGGIQLRQTIPKLYGAAVEGEGVWPFIASLGKVRTE